MRAGIIFIIWMMTAQFCYSQTGYPKLIVYNGDKVVAITPNQARSLLLARERLKMFQELCDSLEFRLRMSVGLIASQKKLVHSLIQEKSINQRLITNYKNIEDEYDLQLSVANKKLKNRNRLIYILGGGLIISTGCLVGIILLNR